MSLPEGWASAEIGELCDLINGKAFKPKDWSTTGLPIIRIQNLNKPDAPYNHCDFEVDERFIVHSGALLFAWSGTPGTSFGAHIWNGPTAVLNQHIFRVRFDEADIDKRFLKLAINSKLEELIGKAHGGVGLAHVTKGKFQATEILIPPLAEQRRIVAKLDALTAHLTRARAELDRVPVLAERMRETAITTAFQGWERRPLEEVSNEIRYGFTASAEPAGPGSKFLRITDIRNRQVDWSKVPFVQPEAKDIARCGLRTGDIVFARSGATVGKSFLVNDPPPDAVFASYLIRVRVNGDLIFPQIAAYYFQSGEYWEQIKAGATGTGQPNFNGSKLAKLLVPVGSREDQSAAVRLIELAFARADRLEAEVAKARALLDRMEAAILARAFRGELVPQDPADEPATVLLDRIRAERAAAPKPKRGRRKKATA